MNENNENNLHIPFTPRPAQQVILDLLATHRFVTAVCHRRLGKTLLAVYFLILSTLQNQKPSHLKGPFRAAYIAPTQKQARQLVWQYFKILLAPFTTHRLITISESEMTIRFPAPTFDDQQISIYGAENAEALRGLYYDALTLDELASWRNPHYTYHEVIRPALADRQGRALFIGTPKTLDLFYDLYSAGLNPDPIYQDYISIRLPASKTNIIPPQELEQLRQTMSPDAYAREMECDFFSEPSDILITPADVKTAISRSLTPAQQEYSLQQPIYFGIDPGRHSDPTVLFKRQGLILPPPLLHTYEPDSMKNAQRIYSIIQSHTTTNQQFLVFVDAGTGAGIIDRLRQLGLQEQTIEVHFNQTSPEPGAYNMRAAIYLRLKRFLQSGVLLLPDDPHQSDQFLRELTNQELDLNEPDNRIKLTSKKKIMERLGGHSPNMADAAALTFTELDDALANPTPPSPRQQLRNLAALYGPEPQYDPLTYTEALYEGIK